MPCSINFSVTLRTEILLREASDFLNHMIILKSFNSVFYLLGNMLRVDCWNYRLIQVLEKFCLERLCAQFELLFYKYLTVFKAFINAYHEQKMNV